MAQDISNQIISTQIADDLWLNLAPITEQNLPYYELKYWNKLKFFHDDSGLLGFFSAIYAYIDHGINDEHVKLYSFLATSKQYTGGNPLDYNLELFFALTVDSRSHFSNHMGTQKLIVDKPHPKVSIAGHAFCAKVTQRLDPEIKIMIFSPMPTIRLIIVDKLEEIGEENAMTILSPPSKEQEQSFMSKFAKIKHSLSEHPDDEAIKSTHKTYEIVEKHIGQNRIFQDDSNFIIECEDGMRVNIGKEYPNWFGKNSNNLASGFKTAVTAVNLETLSELYRFGGEIHFKEEVDDMLVIIGDSSPGATD